MNRARDLFLSSWLCFSLFGEHALLKLAKALAILLGSVKPSTDTDSLHLLLAVLTYVFQNAVVSFDKR